jgi:hypothetical protein
MVRLHSSMVVAIGLFIVFLFFEVILLRKAMYGFRADWRTSARMRNHAFINLAMAEGLILLAFGASHPFTAFIPESLQTVIYWGAGAAMLLTAAILFGVKLGSPPQS